MYILETDGLVNYAFSLFNIWCIVFSSMLLHSPIKVIFIRKARKYMYIIIVDLKSENTITSMQHSNIYIYIYKSVPHWYIRSQVVLPGNSSSASHDNWCTGTLLNRIITALGGDRGCRVDKVQAGTTLPVPDHKCLSYCNCQRSTHSIFKWIFRNLARDTN